MPNYTPRRDIKLHCSNINNQTNQWAFLDDETGEPLTVIPECLPKCLKEPIKNYHDLYNRSWVDGAYAANRTANFTCKGETHVQAPFYGKIKLYKPYFCFLNLQTPNMYLWTMKYGKR